MKRIIFFILISLLHTVAVSQCYEPNLQKADAAYARGDWQTAYNYYRNASKCPDAKRFENGKLADAGMVKCQPVLTVDGEKDVVVYVVSGAGNKSFRVKNIRLSLWRVATNYRGYGLELTPDVSTGVLAASWNANTQPTPREFEITIWGEGGVSDAKATIRIIQAKSELTINGQTSLEKTFSWEGGAARFDVSGISAGQDYTVSGVDASWMSIQKKSDHFFLIVNTNDHKVSGRTKTITVSSNNQTVNIQVSQSPCDDKEDREAKSHVNLGGLCVEEEALIPFLHYSHSQETKHGLLNSRGDVVCFDCSSMENEYSWNYSMGNIYTVGNKYQLHSKYYGEKIWINNRCFIQIYPDFKREKAHKGSFPNLNIYRHQASLFNRNSSGIKEVKKYELLIAEQRDPQWSVDKYYYNPNVYCFKNGDFVITYRILKMVPNTDADSTTWKMSTKIWSESELAGVETVVNYYMDYFHSDGTFICRDSSYSMPKCFEEGIVKDSRKEKDLPYNYGLQKRIVWLEPSIIKRDGTITRFPSEVNAILDISDGVALFANHDNFRHKRKYGYCDLKGEIVIPAKYGYALPFSEGLALVQDEDRNEIFFIDIKGKRQKIRGDVCCSFSEGVAAGVLKGKYLIFVNKKNKIVIHSITKPWGLDLHPYGYSFTKDSKIDERLFTFHDGVAIIDEKRDSGVGESLIDKQGKLITDRMYTRIIPMNNGLFVADNKNGFAVIKKNGESVFEDKHPLISYKNDGTGKIAAVNNRWSFDSTGVVFDGETAKNIVKIHATTSPSIFSVNGVYGYFNDTLGVVTIPPRFNEALPFSEDLAAVKVNSRWGFIDEKGELVIPTVFEQVKPFSNGRAEVVIDGKTYYIDKKGTILEE